jgi:hypothetical protein
MPYLIGHGLHLKILGIKVSLLFSHMLSEKKRLLCRKLIWKVTTNLGFGLTDGDRLTGRAFSALNIFSYSNLYLIGLGSRQKDLQRVSATEEILFYIFENHLFQ